MTRWMRGSIDSLRTCTKAMSLPGPTCRAITHIGNIVLLIYVIVLIIVGPLMIVTCWNAICSRLSNREMWNTSSMTMTLA